jgi:hypothetical protein
MNCISVLSIAAVKDITGSEDLFGRCSGGNVNYGIGLFVTLLEDLGNCIGIRAEIAKLVRTLGVGKG